MQTFKEYINESTKIMGKIKPFEKVIFTAFVEYFRNRFNVSGDVRLRALKKIPKNKFGYVNLNDLDRGIYTVTVERGSIPYTFYVMTHEFTHLHQFIQHKIGSEGDMITWNGKPHISVSEYNSMSYNTYKELPWEREAIKNSKNKSIYNDFMRSDYYTNMRGLDPMVDYIMDNDLM